ncbi:quinone oxidoreductase family protein [Streptomyces graminofaciens]|nr:zinc-binding dehydrogenase [Streptomyces graminofaciens]
MTVEKVPVPRPAPGQVLVEVAAAGVNYADAIRRLGEYYPQPTVFPFTMGGEFTGKIVARGEGVTGHKEGDTVFALHNGGGYAEYAVAEQGALIPVPDGLDPVVGLALVIQGLTAVAILKDAGPVRPGDTVLVQAGGGGVGLLAVQLAKMYGAGRVIAMASTAEKRATALDHGADVAVDSSSDGWAAEAREATGGKGVDLVLEMTGGSVFTQSVDLLTDFGTVVVYGVAGREPPILAVEQLIPRNISVRAFNLHPYLMRPDFTAETLCELADHVAEGRLRVALGGRFTLETAQEMHRSMEARQTHGKLVVIPR